MSKLEKYPKYKDSGIEWLGEIPEGWEIAPLRAIFSERNEKNDGIKTDFILSVTKNRGVIPYDEKGAIGNNKSEDIEKYKLVYPNDFVINKMNVIIGSLGISKYFGAFSHVYLVYQPYNKNVNIKYFSYIFHNPVFYKSLIRICTGIMELRESINKNEFKKQLLPFPSIHEQTKIANYLDQKTAQIDKAISLKEQMIERLKERRQIIINDAVTKGDVQSTADGVKKKMKNSGIEWLGEIPEHWEVRKLKYIVKNKLKYGANESGIKYNQNLPRYVRITDFSISGKLSEKNKLSLPWEKSKNFLLKDGDILFARSGATVGKTYQFKKSMSNEKYYAFAGYLIKAEANEKIILSDYLYLYTNSNVFENWKDHIFNKATIENIGADKYSELLVIIPPKEEQQQIIEYIDNQTAKIDKAIELQQNYIEKLKEYKATLIDSVVTGKVRVVALENIAKRTKNGK